MAELGAAGAQLHAEMGALARDCGVTRLLAVGDGSKPAVETFGPGATWYAGTDDLIDDLRAALHAGLTVYVKGSRVNRLERVTAALAPGAATAGGH
jgi:UDP-N-acetylmuramoyl-tripeptide--D-alanyl-D-alanine ligase